MSINRERERLSDKKTKRFPTTTTWVVFLQDTDFLYLLLSCIEKDIGHGNVSRTIDFSLAIHLAWSSSNRQFVLAFDWLGSEQKMVVLLLENKLCVPPRILKGSVDSNWTVSENTCGRLIRLPYLLEPTEKGQVVQETVIFRTAVEQEVHIVEWPSVVPPSWQSKLYRPISPKIYKLLPRN